MELKFDKEMDALLRRTRPRDGTAGPVGPAEARPIHLDADAIAAFAENRLPAPARLLAIQHAADCTACRNQIAFSISQLEDAAPDTAQDATSVTVAGVPWYRRLFTTPGLAVAFGALVIVFGGLFGYLALRQSGEADVAMVSDTTVANTASSIPETQNSNTATSAFANSQSNAAGAATNSPAETRAARSAAVSTANAAVPGIALNEAADSVAKPNPAPAAAAAPPPPPPPLSTADASAAGETVIVTDGQDAKKREVRSEIAELPIQSRNREALLATPKQKSGPSRGQTQTQTQIQSLPRVDAARRDASGRSFVKRDGAWYDTAYSGQQTIDIRRGSEQFRKLDSGLRNIANSIDGVVVALWKGKAYRIQ
jgi:hypothetical protein